MLFVVPEKIRNKFHYDEGYGGHLDEPYTDEEKKICDEFIQRMKEAAKQEIEIED